MPQGEDSARFEFLSDEWIEAVASLREELGTVGVAAVITLRANLVVTEVPFASGDLHAHVDTSRGGLVIDRGHLEGPDLSVTVTWVTAKALLVEGNPQAALSAFMEGKVRIEGDVGKLMAFQSGVVDASTQQVAARVRALTA